MAVEIRLLRAGDETVLDAVAEDVFDKPVTAGWAHAFLAEPSHRLIVAMDDTLIIGFVSGVRCLHPDKPPQLCINEVGVAPTHHGRGIGKPLLAEILTLGAAEGCSEAWVLMERGNAQARALYRAVGGVEDDAIASFTFPLGGAAKE